MMRESFVQKWTERPRFSKQFWAVLISFFGSLGFLLFQGGKLALMLFVIMSVLSLYLLLGQWSGIKRTQGARTLGSIDHGGALEAGSTLGVTIHLQIPGFWPMPYIFVKDRLYHRNGSELEFEATIVPDWRRRGEWEYRTPALRRGSYTFGVTECVTEDVFGLFEHSGTLNLPYNIVVLPKTVAIREWQQFHQMMKGTNHHSTTTRAVRETTQINGVREYIYGDRLSRIHWNATAKTGTWKSKEFERESLPKTFLVLDRERKAYGDPETFELAVSVAASLFQYGAARSLALGLLSTGADDIYFEPKSGGNQQKAVQQHFIHVEADGVHALKQVLREKAQNLVPGSFVALITPAYGESMLQICNWLKQLQLNPCHLWLCSEPDKKERWLKQLQSRGIAGYAIQSLHELSSLLGGRSG
ncbi:DUF58 domain-containing protein [Paenibacillus doosanensis]|uniref:DUF58 domain-containing protein n=1 Tax=Paenibacillus konkukensis TaxID=2020716 RepID=A0ABY4RI85_9BACL|nr:MULTISPECIES: DUF58 domain-containing protein [Paenibacillus]MCS7461666.1 DUF58 domain-containing protein [Paenibacillus doosanensis]UQZ82092.1 hypothetical protein SK3146_01249 [Paenibacillus konkukensis]